MRRRAASNTSAQSPHAWLHEALPTMWTHMLDRSLRVRTRSFVALSQYLPSHSDPDGLRYVVPTRPEVRPDTVYSPHPCGSPFGPAKAVQIRSRRICIHHIPVVHPLGQLKLFKFVPDEFVCSYAHRFALRLPSDIRSPICPCLRLVLLKQISLIYCSWISYKGLSPY